MGRREEDATIRVHVHLFEADYQWLRENFAAKANGPGLGKIVREIVHKYTKSLQARVNAGARTPAMETLPEIELKK